MSPLPKSQTVAQVVADYLFRRGVRRIYGLVGGHIQPMWDAASRGGIDIVDVRHEAAAVYMAHAEAELSGMLGVAMVTAGPGLTNAITAICNAWVSKAPILVISGRPPRQQAGRGAMQEVPQAEIVRPVTRRIEVVSENHHLASRLDAAVLAALGEDGAPGPAYIDFPTDLLYESAYPEIEYQNKVPPRTVHILEAAAEDIDSARRLIAKSRRPVIIAGKSAHAARNELIRYLNISGALYLDTGESRGAVPHGHAAYVPAMRSRVIQEADLVITLGRRLDYQLAYGSSAVFSRAAAFLRIGRSSDEISENRRGDVEIRADSLHVLAALAAVNAVPDNPDWKWLDEMRSESMQRQETLIRSMAGEPSGSDGRMHPYRLLTAINAYLDENSVLIMDGGDILSFARVGLLAVRSLDSGALGCLGVGVPFATAAALTNPGRTVVAVIGDGSFGFTAMEVSTAVRHGAKALFVVANNSAWNIDRRDQIERYGGHLVGVDLPDHRYDLVAKGLGAYGESVDRVEDLDGAITRALDNAPAVLNVFVTRDAISPDFKNGLAAVPCWQPLRRWDEMERLQYQ